MKKSYKRIIIFEAIISLILLLNSFIFNFLSGYITVIFLISLLVVFKILCGFEKDRHRYIKDILFEIIIFLLIFFLLYYLFGIIIGFAKILNYLTISGISSIILPIVITVILEEFLRYQVMTKLEMDKKLIILSCIFFIFLDVSTAIYYGDFSSPYGFFIFISLTLLPAVSKNIVATYTTLKFGYKPMLLYILIISLYQYIIPIVPNPNEFISSLVQFLLPIALLIRINRFVEKEKDKEIDRDYKKRSIVAYILPTIIVIVAVYFTSGYFRFYAVAIASGSMDPEIKKGDVVIIDKQFETPKIGQVIAFKHDNIIVVHRLINIVKAGKENIYYTKGDANAKPDNYPIEENQIVGIVNTKIPFIGIPTVWINEL